MTEWVYGVTTGTGSPFHSNDLVKEVRYPDATTGASRSTDKDTITVNALGQKLTVTDRNGNTHSYSYDIVGRQTTDAVTTLGSGVDGAVRRIVTAYDGQGNANLVTSYFPGEEPGIMLSQSLICASLGNPYLTPATAVSIIPESGNSKWNGMGSRHSGGIARALLNPRLSSSIPPGSGNQKAIGKGLFAFRGYRSTPGYRLQSHRGGNGREIPSWPPHLT